MRYFEQPYKKGNWKFMMIGDKVKQVGSGGSIYVFDDYEESTNEALLWVLRHKDQGGCKEITEEEFEQAYLNFQMFLL